MAIFEFEGKRYRVRDEHIERFAKDFPDATSIMERNGKRYRVKSSDYKVFMSEVPENSTQEQPRQQAELSATVAAPKDSTPIRKEQAWQPAGKERVAMQRELDGMARSRERTVKEFGDRMETMREFRENAPLGPGTAMGKRVFNPESGKLEQSYITPAGNRFHSRVVADAESLRFRQAADMSVGGRLRRATQKLAELKAKRAESASRVHEETERFNNEKLTSFGRLFIGGEMYRGMQQGDRENNALDIAIRETEELIKDLEEQKDRDNGTDVGFWRGFGRIAGDARTWDFGTGDLKDALTKMNADRLTGENATDGERDAYNEMMMAIHEKEEVDGMYGGNASFWNRAGVMTGYMPSFMLDFVLTGGGFDGINILSKVGVKAGTKVIGKEVVEQMVKQGFKTYVKSNGVKGLGQYATNWIIKALGTTADDLLIRAPLMTNTVQLGKTASDIIDRKLGDVVVDENGNYDFSNDKTWGSAIWQGEANAIIENYSEMFGAHLDPVMTLGNIGRLAHVVGAKRIGNVLAKADAGALSGIMGQTHKLFSKMGVSDYLGEVAEEYYGQLWRTMLNLDDAYQSTPDGSRTNLLATGQFHGDIWGGMALSMGLMGAGKHTLNAATYASMKHGVNKADVRVNELLGTEIWEPLKATIDLTTNENVGEVAELIVNDDEFTNDEKVAILEYMERSMYLRGLNLASVAQSRNIEQNADVQQVNESFLDGYSIGGSQEMNDAKNLFEFHREQMGELVDEKMMTLIETDPVAALEFVGRTDGWNDDERASVIDYINAKQVYDGMIQRVRDDIDARVEQSHAMIDSRVNRSNGMILSATMKQDDRRVYVVGGNLVPYADGSGIDKSASDGSIIVRDAETGALEQVSPDAVLNIDEPLNPYDEKMTAEGAIRQQFAREASDKIDGVVTFNPGDTYTITGDDAQIQVQIVANESGIVDNGDGTVNVSDGVNIFPLAKETIQQQVDVANLARVAQFEQQRTFENAERKQEMQEANSPQYALNDIVLLTDENGNSVRGNITADADADGKYEVYTEDAVNGKRVNLFTADELNNMIVEHNGQIIKPIAQNTGEIVQNPTEIAQNHAEIEQPKQPQVSAFERIPKDEQGNPLYEQAETPDLAWDAIVEQTDGDMAMAQSVADGMVADKDSVLKRLEKAKSKGGATIAEKIAAEKERKAAIDAAKQELAIWQKIAGTANRRKMEAEAERRRIAEEAAALRKVEVEKVRAEREEAERIEREVLNGVPDMVDDTPQDARARGYRRVSGHKIDRQEAIQALLGKEIAVKFNDSTLPKGRVAVIEAEQLQPSHIQGVRNPLHFIDEAQPKERNDEASVLSARKIAGNIRPEEITSSVTAYTGAPTVNARGEAIQGNNRSDALRLMWKSHQEQAAKYKQYLMEHAEEFGLNADDIAGMQHPVLVNMLDVEDADAISLGQFMAQDTESGGLERIKPKNVLQRMGADTRSFANLLLKSADEETSFAGLVDNNGVDVLKWMSQKGYITPTQYRSAFDSKGNLSAEAKNDLRGIMYQSIFKGGSTRLEEMFNAMPAKAQKAILATAFRDYDSPSAERMIGEIQNSIRAYYALSQSAGFVNAKTFKDARLAVEGWKIQYQIDDATGESYLPSDNFSNFALLLATMYKGESQSIIQGTFNKLYDLIQGTQEPNLFEQPDNTPRTLAQAINETLNITYNGQQRSNVLVGDSSASQRGQQGSTGNAAAGERIENGERTADSAGGIEGDSRGIRVEQENRGNQGEETHIPQTEEVDEYGNHFVLASDGTSDFGVIDAESGLKQAPIKLSMGDNTIDENGENHGYGLLHIEASRGEAIRNAGYASVQDFVESVAKNYTDIREGGIIANNQTYLLELVDEHNNTLFIQLSKNGEYWTINSAGIFRKKYSRNKRKVYDRPALSPDTNTHISGVDSGDIEGVTTPAGNSPKTSDSKVTTKSRISNELEEKNVQNTIGEQVQAAEAEVNTAPTDKQKEAGNYKKGDVQTGTFNVTIGQPKDSVRSGVDAKGYTVRPAQYTTKKGKVLDMQLVKFGRDLTKEELRNAKALAKGLKGWYDSKQNGFMMRSEDDAKQLADAVMDESGEMLSDAAPVSIADLREVKASGTADIKPTGHGAFGDIYDQFKGKAQEAIAFLSEKQNGEAIGALHHKDVGDIDLVWGNEGPGHSDGFGLAKLVKFHPEVLNDLQGLIDDMHVVSRNANRITLESDTHKSAVQLEWDGEKKNWLLTAFEKENSVRDNTTDTCTTVIGKQNDTATLQNTVSIGKNSDNPSNKQNPSGNKLVTDERYEELKRRMKAKLGQLNMGIDPEIFAIGTEMAVYHIEKGARDFAGFAKAMIADLGDVIRPYLKAFYNGARDLPEVVENGLSAEMTPYDEVSRFDVANFDKESTDPFATAEMVVSEQEKLGQAAVAKQLIIDRRNSERRKENEQTEADTEAIVSEADAVAGKAESDIEDATDESQLNEIADNLDKQIEKVNEQLALLGYYEAEEVEKDFNEMYGYMRNAEKKAVKDANFLAKKLVEDLGIDAATLVDSKGKKLKEFARANIAPAGGEIYIGIPLGNERKLEITLRLDPDRQDNLYLIDGYTRIRNLNPQGREERWSRNVWINRTESYQSVLKKVQREIKRHVPGFASMPQSVKTAAEQMQVLAQRVGRGETPFTVTEDVEKELAARKKADNSFKVGEKVMYKGEPATIHSIDNDRPVLDTGLAPVMYEVAEWADLSPVRQNIGNKPKKESNGKKKSVYSQTGVADLFGGLFDDLFAETNKADAELHRQFAMTVKADMLAALDNGTKPYRSILDLRKRASELGMEVDNDGRTDILLQELVEDGLVRAAREVIVRKGRNSRASYDLICKLYEMQPTIAARSSNRIKMQQYSTPLPMAWIANRFAMANKADGKVLEPTAGNGMLVFTVPVEQVHVNELDETRLDNLREQGFAEVTQQDATEPFEGGMQYDVVIANPPFGKREAVEYDGKMIPGLDPQITLNALASMKDDGRAAIIIGGNMEYASNGAIKNMKPFFTYLYDHYNVKGVIDMSGGLYAKQGTTFPTRMILIDGRRSEEERAQTSVYPPVESKAIRKAESFDDLYEIINEVLNSNEKTNGTEILRSRQGQLASVNNNTSGNTNGARHREQPRKNDEVGSRGSQSERNSNRGEQVLSREHRANNADGETRTETSSDNARGSRGVSDSDVQRVGTERVSTDGVGLKQTTAEHKKRTLTDEKSAYRPHNSAFSLNSVAPAAMVEAMDKVLTQIEEKHGSIDEFIRTELAYDTVEEAHQALAAEQMDSVAMAIYQMKQGQALIIGDQTGVGKGRQMAALIRWAVKRGEKPVFITQKADLFSDIYRDLVDVGSGDLVPFIFNSDGAMVDSKGNTVHKPLSSAEMAKVFASGALPDEYDFAVLTYSQVNTGDAVSQQEMEEAAKKSGARTKKSKNVKNGKATPKATFLRAIAEDNYLFLDESHTAAGSSNTGAYLQSILRGAKAATFASATFAKRPDTMPLYAIRTAMSQAKVEPDKMISIIEKGGVTLQEIMSRELTNAGQMVRRERDMSDVVTDWKTITDPETVRRARENYDRTIAAFNAIIKFQEDYVKPMIEALDMELAVMAESAGVKRGTDKMGVENVPFASKTYNYTKQLMLALKVEAIADEVEAEINAGRHPVIALESTMESSIKDYAAGEVIDEPTFSASLLKGLDTVMQYTVKDENGNERHERYSPKALGQAGEKAYYELQDFIRESTSDIFISPLDAIIERLHEKGYKVGELTGRNMYVERNADGRVVVKRRTDKDKKRMQREFNSGVLDVLILNKSASTGISLHASEKFSDQRQRSMIIAQPLSDINDYMQMIGRIDRTGQVHRGYYINLGLPVPAENRFLMMLSTKLKSLNANTTTSQDSESNDVEAPDLLNKYGSQVVIEYLRDNVEIYEKMGAPLKKGGLGGGRLQASELDEYKPQEDDARKVTGYVALLTTKEQEEFYDDVVRRYNELIKYLNDTGSNDLKITVMPLRAKTIEKRVSSEGIDPNGNNPFARNSFVEKVEMDVLRKPMKADEIRKVIEQINRGVAPAEYLKRVIEIIRTEDEARIAAEEERYKKAKAKAVEDIAKQTEKINGQKKRSDEEKRVGIEIFIAETNEKVEAKHNDNVVRLNANSDQLLRRLRMFETGKSYLVPDNLEAMIFDFATPAIFCGYKTKDSKITASTTLAVFATLDGRRRIEIKLSQIDALRSIEKMTNDNWDAARYNTLDNWDSQIPTETRKTGFIMTGNILQAIADTQDEHGGYPGQLISYTDIDGNVHDGILMPDKWNASMLKTSGAPLSSRLQQIKEYQPVKSHDGKVEIMGSSWAKTFYLTVPKTKKDGAVYYENKTLLRAAGGIFYPYRGQLRADIPAERIDEVVKELTKLGVKVKEERTDDDTLYRSDDAIKNRIEALFNEAISGEFNGKPISIGRLTDEGKAYLEQISGVAFKEYVDFVLNPSDLVHIYKGHFGNNETDERSIPLDIEDIRNIADVISFPDRIIYAKENVGEKRKMFFFLKEAENGTYNLLEIYADKKGNLTAKTFYKTKEGVSQRAMTLSKSLHTTSETDGATLNDDAKIPQMFESASVEDENSNREVTEAERKRMADRVETLAKKLHLDNVEIVTDASTLTSSNQLPLNQSSKLVGVRSIAELEGKKQRAKGFYSKSTGKITIVIPNHRSTFDVEQTLLHEAVAHYGLRQLFGEHFDTFLDNVFNNADEDIRRKIVDMSAKNAWDFHKATEEYLAGLAERTNFEEAKKSGWWQRVKDFFSDMLGKLGFANFGGVTLTDNELRYVLWRSYENLKGGKDNSLFGDAADIAMQYELGIGKYEDNPRAVNERFNEGLERYAKGEMGKNEYIQVGNPMGIMRNFMPDIPIILRQKVVTKANNKHKLTASEIKDLPKSLANPIFVFKSRENTISVLTELKSNKGQNIFVAMELGTNKQMGHEFLEVNEITTIHGRETENIVNPILENATLRYVHKEKGIKWLSSAKSNSQAIATETLSTVTKIVENFKNPMIGDENDVLFRDGDPEMHERTLARQRYEQRMKSGMYQLQEALQDSMLGLKEAMTAILGKNTRIEDVAGFENAYLGENRLSSVNKAEADAFAHLLFKPMLDEVAKLAKSEGEREELTDYMMAKHGLERNRVMAERDAQKEFADNQKQHPKSSKSLQDFIDEFRNRDYAGLTDLTGMESVADAEAEAQAMVEEYENGHDTTALWSKVNAVSEAILSKSYECGMMGKETYEDVKAMYEYYIPLRGFDEKTSAEAYAYLSHRQSAFNAPIKKAEGRVSKADDPFANLQSMAESAIMQGNRNRLVKQRFLNFVLNHPSDLVSVSDLWLRYDAVSDEWIPVFPDNIEINDSPEVVERKVQDFEERMRKLAESDPMMYKHGKDAVNIPYRVVESRDLREHQVVVKRNGRDYVITVNGNPRLAQALNGQTNPDNDISGSIGVILRAGEWINRQLSAFYTTRNPDFIVSNFVRDMLYTNSMVWIKESPNYALRFNRNVAKVNPARMKILLAKHRNGRLDMDHPVEKMFHLFMMNGGETGYANIRDIDQHKDDIKRELKKANGKLKVARAWELLGERFDELNRAVENCARFAAFMTSHEMGRTIDRAIYDAKEISVNFNKKGSGAKFLHANGQSGIGNVSAFMSGIGRSGYVFWNAAIQGTTNFGRQLKRHPAKALTGAAAMFLLGAVVAYLGGDDDDDEKNGYYNLPEYVRRSNLLFSTGDHWVSLPLPIEYRAFYGMGELMTSVLSGKEHFTGAELAEQIAAQVSQILPLDLMNDGGLMGLVPSAAKPIAEVLANKSWTGMPIYKDTPYNKYMPEWTKAYKSANKYIVGLAVVLNEATGGDPYSPGVIDINPAQVEYLLNGYFGGVSGTIDKLVKSAETVAGEREYDPRSFLLWNRLVKAGDERTEYRAVNNEYFRLKEEHDRVKFRLKRYEDDTYNGVFDYAEKIDFLYNSPEYERYEIFEWYMPEMDALYKELKIAVDDDERREIETELNEVKKEMIAEMNLTRKRK